MTVKDAAQRWNVTERLVQRLCAEGRVDGTVKFGRSWSIPVSARKPNDSRRADSAPQAAMPRPRRVPGSHANLMPLMNTPFAPGTCAEFVDSLAPGPRRGGVHRPGYERASASACARGTASCAGRAAARAAGVRVMRTGISPAGRRTVLRWAPSTIPPQLRPPSRCRRVPSSSLRTTMRIVWRTTTDKIPPAPTLAGCL